VGQTKTEARLALFTYIGARATSAIAIAHSVKSRRQGAKRSHHDKAYTRPRASSLEPRAQEFVDPVEIKPASVRARGSALPGHALSAWRGSHYFARHEAKNPICGSPYELATT